MSVLRAGDEGVTRPTRDEWGLSLARLTATRATCHRLAVGCVLLNVRGQLLSTGYNGRASGLEHCLDRPEVCPGSDGPRGAPNGCQAVHAEANALLQARDVYAIHTCYTSLSPCAPCVKLLLNTGCQRIVFGDLYPNPEGQALWTQAGRLWVQL